MKLHYAVCVVIVIVTFPFIFLSSAASMDDPGFTIKRMLMCKEIAAREPVDISETFSADTEKVYCYLEANAIEHDTTVSFVWYYGEKEMSRVSLPIAKGRRWRTYASKKLAGLKGSWKVELLDPYGIVINTVSFQVQ